LSIDQNGSSWQQTAYIDAGVSMEITARVDTEGNIIATIAPKVNSMTGYTSNGSPIIGTREVKTTIRLEDGETMVLGGLIKEESFESENGLPILSEIPLLGKLFSTTRKQERKTELIILLKVTIIP
jgi:type II secretory pathway component GspD/PulD (secretin)